MFLKSRPVNSNRFRTCIPYSSPVLTGSVVNRHWTINSSSRNTPNVMFVLPASMTRSIGEFLGAVWRSGKNLLDKVRRSAWTIFLLKLPADFHCPAGVRRLVEQFVYPVCHSRCEVVFPVERATRA